MGRDSAGIFQTFRDAALIQQTGGGQWLLLLTLAPERRDGVDLLAGQAPGPVGFLQRL